MDNLLIGYVLTHKYCNANINRQIQKDTAVIYVLIYYLILVPRAGLKLLKEMGTNDLILSLA